MQGAVHPSSELLNARVYHSRRALAHYTEERLNPSETVALLKYQAAFYRRDVLDIGVGTGRTARYLEPLAHHYTAIDYSPVMVNYIRRTAPHIDVRQIDMCDLSAFEAESFDFILAPNNVLDAVSHQPRLEALREWRRVLRNGGVLMMSSHNRNYRYALSGPRLDHSRNPVTQARHLLRYARCSLNFLRYAGQRQQTQEFALLTDSGHEYRLLHYYVDRAHECAQLQSLGFRCLEVLDGRARTVSGDDSAPDSPSLLYVAQRVD